MWFGSGPDDCYTVIDRFNSKRNPVLLVECRGRKYVFKAKPDCEREVSILKQLYGSGVAVPRVVGHNHSGFVMDFIPGQPFVDYLEIQEAQDIPPEAVRESLRCLVDWFAAFYEQLHRSQGLIMGDVNMRNFLYDGDRITAVDFEACRTGPMEADAGRLAAFLLNYDPPGTTWKKQVTSFLLEEAVKQLQVDMTRIKMEAAAEMKAMERRRNRHIGKELFLWIDSLDV